MSLMGTLARIGVAIIAAKGAGKVLDQLRQPGRTDAGAGPEHGSGVDPGRSGGLEDLLGSVLGGKDRSGGGLGDILSDLGGGRKPGGGRRGLEDIIRDLGGKRSGGGSPLDDLLGGILGGAAAGGRRSETADGQRDGRRGDHPAGSERISDIFNQAFSRRGEPETRPTPEQDAAAGLMLRAMIHAARADGRIDESERQKLFQELGDASVEERAFVERELSARVDAEALARQVPDGLEQPVYTMSVLAIDLDNRNEGQYLHDLATAMGLGRDAVNQIHARIGAPPLYR